MSSNGSSLSFVLRCDLVDCLENVLFPVFIIFRGISYSLRCRAGGLFLGTRRGQCLYRHGHQRQQDTSLPGELERVRLTWVEAFSWPSYFVFSCLLMSLIIFYKRIYWPLIFPLCEMLACVFGYFLY